MTIYYRNIFRKKIHSQYDIKFLDFNSYKVNIYANAIVLVLFQKLCQSVHINRLKFIK